MEKIEASQNDQVAPVITGVDNVIRTFKEVIMWEENTEPGILPKDLYDAFYEFVAFNLGTKQPFLDTIAKFLRSQHGILISNILQNKKFSGQLMVKDAFDYLNSLHKYEDNIRTILNAVSEEFTSGEYDKLVEIFDDLNNFNREEKLEEFQNIFEKSDHKNFLRALWMLRWVLTGINEDSESINVVDEGILWHWQHYPMFHPSVQKEYMEFQIMYAVLQGALEGDSMNPLLSYTNDEAIYTPKYEQYDCKKVYYLGWREHIKKQDSKLLSEISNLSSRDNSWTIFSESNLVCRIIPFSGFINSIRKNGLTKAVTSKYNQEWFSKWAHYYVEDYNIPEDERYILSNIQTIDDLINGAKFVEDWLDIDLKCYYSERDEWDIQKMGEAILLYSKMMFDVYNVVKDLLDEEQKQELLQMLKRCYYTNCLLPYYVDDYEPETTEEKHQLNDFSVSPESSYVDIINFFDNDSIYSKKTVKKGNYTLTAKQLFTNYTEMFIKESKKIGNQLDVYAFMYMWVMSELFNVNMIINLVLPEVLRRLLLYSSFDNNDGWRNLINEYTIRVEGVQKKLEKKGENAQLVWKDICGIVPIMYDVIFGGSFFSMRKHRGRKSIDIDVQPPYESIAIRRIYTGYYFEKEYKERHEGTVDDHNVSFPQFLRDYYAPGYFLSPAEYYYKAYREKDDNDESKKSLAVQLYNMIKQEQLYNRVEQEHENI